MSTTSTILSVGEIIDLAFGNPDENIVNHKLIQTILHLLARQLRLLERKVEIKIGSISSAPETSLSVTEIKVHAMQEKLTDKKKKTRDLTQSSKTGITNIDTTKLGADSLGVRKIGATQDSTDTSSTKKSLLEKSDQINNDARKYLEIVEEAREKELRIIHQRADSKECQRKEPTPMTSLESVEAQYEKLLVVERVPSHEAKSVLEKRSHSPRLSVVTQNQFVKLANAVRDLQLRFAPIAPPGFPNNIQFLQELRKGASLTDAMAALQLSARLEAAEKTLSNMLGLITELAIQTGIDISEIPQRAQDSNLMSRPDQGPVETKEKGRKAPLKQDLQQTSALEATQPEDSKPGLDAEKEKDTVSKLELDTGTQALNDEIIKYITTITARSTENANNACRIATRLEGKLEVALNLGDRMENLETLVSNYAAQINVIDTNLSSQMSSYQEQLTQMQHDLESGLETMAETMANSGGDTTAVAELNTHFTSLQTDFDSMTEQQKGLKAIQSTFSYDLEALWKQIEHLKATKSDRDEVADALRDKAGIGALNGLVSMQQFDAVRGDYEKRIGAAYDKFNNQEIVWQKAIDDILRDFDEKADLIQLISLKEDIAKNLNMLLSRINAMMEIVGEPRAAGVTKRLHRDAACISCSTPAHMALEEPGIVPALPVFHATRPTTIGAEAPKPKEDGDHGTCYLEQPIPYSTESRAHACNRYCGGSHTVINSTLTRAPVGIIIHPVPREVTTGIGSDGKTYVMDASQSRKHCTDCNTLNATAPQPVKIEKVLSPDDTDSEMVPMDFREMSKMMSRQDNISITPPPPLDNMG